MDGLKDFLFIFLTFTPTIVSFVACFYIYKYKKQIQILQKQLKKETNNQREYFTQTLKHDLKIPTLAQLRGLDVLKDGICGELNQEQKDMIEEVQKSCKYVLDIISTVLKTYRIETSQNKLSYQNFNINDLVSEVFEENTNLSLDKIVNFEVKSNSKAIYIEADKEEIKKVIENLLLNAVFYSNEFEKISVDINADEDCLSFSVLSKGIALSKKECSTLFEYFTPQKVHYGAIGERISLYLSKKIIDMHNGKIFAISDEAGTNTFNFIIPIRQKALNFNLV